MRNASALQFSTCASCTFAWSNHHKICFMKLGFFLYLCKHFAFCLGMSFIDNGKLSRETLFFSKLHAQSCAPHCRKLFFAVARDFCPDDTETKNLTNTWKQNATKTHVNHPLNNNQHHKPQQVPFTATTTKTTTQTKHEENWIIHLGKPFNFVHDMFMGGMPNCPIPKPPVGSLSRNHHNNKNNNNHNHNIKQQENIQNSCLHLRLPIWFLAIFTKTPPSLHLKLRAQQQLNNKSTTIQQQFNNNSTTIQQQFNNNSTTIQQQFNNNSTTIQQQQQQQQQQQFRNNSTTIQELSNNISTTTTTTTTTTKTTAAAIQQFNNQQLNKPTNQQTTKQNKQTRRRLAREPGRDIKR